MGHYAVQGYSARFRFLTKTRYINPLLLLSMQTSEVDELRPRGSATGSMVAPAFLS